MLIRIFLALFPKCNTFCSRTVSFTSGSLLYYKQKCKFQEIYASDWYTYLGRDEKLITYTTFLSPFANNLFGSASVTVKQEFSENETTATKKGDWLVTCSVNKITTIVEIGIEKFETRFFRHLSHSVPLVADAHSPKANGRDMDTSIRRQHPISSEAWLWNRYWGERIGHIRRRNWWLI